LFEKKRCKGTVFRRCLKTIMKKLASIFILISLFFVACKEECPCSNGPASLYGDTSHWFMIKAPGQGSDEWGISDIKKKNIELIAMTKDFGRPLVDKDGKVVKQIRKKVEAVWNTSFLELYMDTEGIVNQVGDLEDSFFILKIDDGLWFHIKATHYLGLCHRVRLKSFVFENKSYLVEYISSKIPIDEKKKREELKERYPNGFPYRL